VFFWLFLVVILVEVYDGYADVFGVGSGVGEGYGGGAKDVEAGAEGSGE
jgi:hypothetical protein